ncbi:lipoprotein [Uruburuella testudinis]|uniref:Lipoprotein n=1 Tax=Uruburuella testudinis TaxID=1282863 RepID=A0ABY4DWM3_9NEIS|nr:lipoprotein [Uruburuella testudinis]UOO83032.1 lipoprotein [Uruburuella testudinis]
MKKILAAALTLLALAGCSALDRMMPAMVASDYYQKTQTGMPLERKYTAPGTFHTASQTFAGGRQRFKTYKVWYPADLPHSKQTYPVVVFANGSGVAYYKYEAIFNHLASWGFVVIGNDDSSSWDGSSTSQSLAFLQQQNQHPDSLFYRKLDLNRAGVSGHSQGGVGAINAVGNFANSHQFKALYTASTPKHALALALKWPYNVGKINVPYFMNAGTGPFDGGDGKDPDSGIAPLTSLRDNYARISGNGLTVMARRSHADHGELLYLPDGYMTAWFRYTLMNDSEAAQVFTGAAPEIRRNTQNWQDVQIKR